MNLTTDKILIIFGTVVMVLICIGGTLESYYQQKTRQKAFEYGYVEQEVYLGDNIFVKPENYVPYKIRKEAQ